MAMFDLKGLLTSAGGRYTSISKSIMLLGAVTSSAVVLWQAYNGTLGADVFAWYLSVTVGANTANKALSVFGEAQGNKK